MVRLWADDVDHGTLLNRFSSDSQLLEHWKVVSKFIAPDARHDEAELESRKILLVFQTAVNRYKYVELFLRVR